MVGVVALCDGVGLLGEGSKTIGEKGWAKVWFHRRERKEGPSQLVCAFCSGHTIQN